MGEVVDEHMISADEIIETATVLLTEPCPSCFEYRVYAAGSGFPDELVIQAYNGTGIPVIDRNWVKWKDGEKVVE